MQTQKIINQALQEYLGDYKHYHTILLLCFVAVQGIFLIWVNTRLEKFKALLKKTEIKFSRYHELQIEALRTAYQKLVLFGIANKSLLNSDYDTNNHNSFKKRINNWIISHNECINQLAYNKIVLPNNLKEIIQETISDFQQVTDILIGERKHLENVEEDGLGDWNAMYSYSENELDIINKKMKKLGEQEAIKKASRNIKVLRDEIERIFENMNT